MKDSKSRPPQPTSESPETQGKDFQFVLKELLAAYQPILEEELKRAKSPDQLEDEAAELRSCEEELQLANRIFEPFTSEKVALSYLPEEARKLLGEPARWRWCLLHIRCCLIFGWLVCRGPRTFRSWSYYLNIYWRCVRQVLETPVSNPLTAAEKKDFEILISALAEAYKPFLTDQLASVEFPLGIPEAIIQGQIDCFTDEEEICVIFERLINTETARALLGAAAFERHSKEPFFWFCRCWCLCALCLGCCLARARNLRDVRRCLVQYFRCLRDCFRPLIAQIDTPTENQCVNTVVVPGCGSMVGVQITGTASGTNFNHYTLHYSWGGGSPVNDAVVYPDCTRPPAHTSYSVAINGGVLGYLDVTMLPPGQTDFTIYLDVFDSGTGHLLVTRDFQLKTVAVEITAAAKVNTVVAEDAFLHPLIGPPAGTIKQIKAGLNPDPNPLIPELSIGGVFSVDGSAYVVGCNRLMTQYQLVQFPLNANSPVPAFPNAVGGVNLIPNVVYGDNPTTHPWQSGCWPAITPNTIENGDLVAVWGSDFCPFPGPHTVPKVQGTVWNSNPLNGRYVIFLEVDDRVLPLGTYPGTLAATDQVTVWIDNQSPIAKLNSIGGITGCGDLRLSDYLTGTAEIRGVAWDPPIDALAPQKAPNDNFGSYGLSFQKDGDPLAGGPIPPATPGVRVPNIWPGPLLVTDEGTLANWDIVSALDGGAGPLPLHSPKLVRGTRCAYVISLSVSDTTHVGDSGNHNSAGPVLYAINVINDL
jgi:hypothetical protein